MIKLKRVPQYWRVAVLYVRKDYNIKMRFAGWRVCDKAGCATMPAANYKEKILNQEGGCEPGLACQE